MELSNTLSVKKYHKVVIYANINTMSNGFCVNYCLVISLAAIVLLVRYT